SPTIVPAPASRHEPFPLTDLQRAYWLGRADYFELGNIGCHVYVEIELPGVDRRRLRAAWQKLINRHEMLRAIIRDDGLQQILHTLNPTISATSTCEMPINQRRTSNWPPSETGCPIRSFRRTAGRCSRCARRS